MPAKNDFDCILVGLASPDIPKFDCPNPIAKLTVAFPAVFFLRLGGLRTYLTCSRYFRTSSLSAELESSFCTEDKTWSSAGNVPPNLARVNKLLWFFMYFRIQLTRSSNGRVDSDVGLAIRSSMISEKEPSQSYFALVLKSTCLGVGKLNVDDNVGFTETTLGVGADGRITSFSYTRTGNGRFFWISDELAMAYRNFYPYKCIISSMLFIAEHSSFSLCVFINRRCSLR
jgi:hypothetical protein